MTLAFRNSAKSSSLRARTAVGCRLIAIACLGLLPAWASAVVCSFSTHVPKGAHMVSHATEWIAGDASGPTRLIQWWFPIADQEPSDAGYHSYGDYLRELLQTGPIPPGERDQAVLERQREISEQAIRRGSPSVRHSHTRAAGMLALREVPAKAGNWPVIWLGGDPSFGDMLASHGFVVVSTPVVYGTEPDFEQRIFAVRDGIERTRQRFGLQIRSFSSVGFNEQAMLAARVSGVFPQSSGLALIGEWTPPDRRDPRRDTDNWFDPNEVRVPTLLITAGDDYVPLNSHPLGSPFSATTRMHFGGMDAVHLEFGMPESCAPKWIVGRRVKPLTLVQSQHAMRLKLSEFVAANAGVTTTPAPLKFLPIDERRKEPLEIHQQTIPALVPAPPALEQMARLVSEGGASRLLAALPDATRRQTPTAWWELAMLQLQVSGDPEQPRTLLDAWQAAQPESLVAAVLRAGAPEADAASSKELWKRARSLVRKDLSVPPLRRRELGAAIDAALAN